MRNDDLECGDCFVENVSLSCESHPVYDQFQAAKELMGYWDQP